MGCSSSMEWRVHPKELQSKSSSQKTRMATILRPVSPPKSSKSKTEEVDWIPTENRVVNIHAVLEFHEQLGRGSTSTVFRAAWRRDDEEEPTTLSPGSDQFCAVKQLRRPRRTKAARREIDLLCGLDHPNILRFEEVFADRENIWMVTELCTGGSLIQYLKEPKRSGVDEHLAKSIMRQLTNAVEHLHAKGIVHRDIKPDNIVFADESKTRIVLIDFGTAKFVDELPQLCYEWVGTPAFMSPEMFGQRSRDDMKGIDMWAVGVTCYVTLTGYFPFFGSDLKTVRREVERKKLAFPKGMRISQESRDFVRKLTLRNKFARMTAGGALNHEWLREE